MYKTVRKGDASLQYTILPQTDQLPATTFASSSSKTIVVDQIIVGDQRPKIIKYMTNTVIVLMVLSIVATPFLFNQNDHNLFANTVLAMGKIEHSMFKNTTKTYTKEVSLGKENKINGLPKLEVEVETRKDVETTSVETGSSENNVSKTSGATGLSTPSSGTPDPTLATSTTTEEAPTTSPTTTKPSTTATSTRMPSNFPRKLPRVTLKLRENETIPQMYMKAGIASYKKGNITTSVLAHGLSLEGLIFKTPEGTIKPWPQKWPFVDPSSYFQWKGMRQMPVMIYFVLAGLAVLATVSIILMFYVQKKASRRQRRSVEEPEMEGQEEDKSTLLGAEAQETETEEKE